MTELPCTGPVTVDARLAGGSLDVVAEERDTALVRVEPYDSSDSAREAAERTEVRLQGDTLVVHAPEASGWLVRRSPRLRIWVRVPTGSSLRARTASAGTTCHGDLRDASVTTASGDVQLATATGDVSVTTASGDLNIDRVQGRLEGKSASGDLRARQVTGEVSLQTASGDIHLDDAADAVSVSSASGDVQLGATRQGDVRIKTVSGDVSVGVRAGTGVWLDVSTLSGGTSSELDVTGDTPPTGHELTLRIRTVSGDIDIRRVPQPATA